MTTETKSVTPECDAEQKRWQEISGHPAVSVTFARRLERERDEARIQRDDARKEWHEVALTINQIQELAEFAGLTISTRPSSLDDMEAEITVMDSPKGHEVIEDNGSRERYNRIAYYSDYPEEGVMPLGMKVPSK